MARWERLIELATRGAQVALLGALGLAMVVDVVVGAQLGHYSVAVTYGALAVAGAVALRRDHLVPASALALLVVLGLSFRDRAGADRQTASLAVVVGMGVLAWAVARRASASAAAVLLPVCVFAVIDQALRPAHAYLAIYLALLGGLGIAAAIGAGGYLRWLDWQRSQAALDARSEERLDIARELHDLVAHYVTGIVVQAQGARAVAEDRPQVAIDALEAIEGAGAEALTAMRRMVGALRSTDDSSMLPPAGLAGLEELVQRTNALGVPARLHADADLLDALPPAVAGSVHRIVQESLTNVRRHSRDATLVDVWITRIDGAVRIVVHDDGADADRPARGAGYGLVGMSERATALGGALRAGPAEGGGWTVEAQVPLAVAARS